VLANFQRRSDAVAAREAAADNAMLLGTDLPAALEVSVAKFRAATEPAAQSERLRQCIEKSVPKAARGWWVARDLANLVIYGRDGTFLDKSVVDRLLQTFSDVRKAYQDRGERMDDPPAYFQGMCAGEITFGKCGIDWADRPKRKDREA
jgi:hypothetical protein